MQKKHILVISQYFYPEQFRINNLCEEWITKGYKVTVLTGIPNYPQGSFYTGYGFFKKTHEKYKGIDIIRIPIIPRGKNFLTLSLNYFSFIVSGFFWNIFTKINADYVFIFEVSPMTQALPGVWYGKKKSIPSYIYVQDLWPENLEVMGIKNKAILKYIDKMVAYIYKNTNRIFVTSQSFKKTISSRREVNEEKVEFWPQYAEDFYVPKVVKEIEEIPSDNKMNIIFTGNIGYAQGLEILPKVAELIMINNPDLEVRFNVVGDGRYKEKLIKQLKQNQTYNMFNFISRQKPEKIPELLAASDIAFLSFSSNPLFSKTIPAKLQSYMACAMPIIASADGESKKIIKDANCGICSSTGDVNGLYNSIIEMTKMSEETLNKFRENSLDYYNKNFNKIKLLKDMDIYFSR